MIWGRTTKELAAKTKERETKGFFAWLPKHLANGRWLWLQRYWRKYWSSWGCSGYNYFENKA